MRSGSQGQVGDESLDDAPRRLPVTVDPAPGAGHRVATLGVPKDLERDGPDPIRISPDDRDGTRLDTFRAFGHMARHDDRYTECGALLLYPTRIGDGDAGATQELHEVGIGQRGDDSGARLIAQKMSDAWGQKVLPVADPVTVKVAVVIQDPRIASMGNKRMHEIFKTPGYTFQWHDPYKLMNDYRDTLNAVSGGAIRYEIVKVYDDTLFFTRLKDEKELLSLDRIVQLLNEPKWETFRAKSTAFDYNSFIDHYDFCEMRDKGEINEVWLWTFPYGGTWESTFAGEGAFWLNSNPVKGTSCKDLLIVMGLNYEREMSLALESYGHRMESIMRKVYGRWDNKASDRNNWEIFTTIDMKVSGKGQVGNIHFPPNGTSDYNWINKN